MPTYASFWKRAAAYLVDGLIYGGISSSIGWVTGMIAAIVIAATAKGGEPSAGATIGVFVAFVIVQLLCFIFYFVWPESSSWQATIGKKILGLQVTDLNGQRISFLCSLGRNLGMIVSAFILCIGYLMCFWTEKKQCLHDMMAGCLVVDTKPNEKQGCIIGAIVMVVGLFIGVFVVGILAAIALPQYTRAVERSRAAEAMVLLKDVKAGQEIYKMSTGRTARNWTQLSQQIALPCTIQDDPTVCSMHGYDFTLTSSGITASRNGESVQYVLKIDNNGNISCQGKDEFICNSLSL